MERPKSKEKANSAAGELGIYWEEQVDNFEDLGLKKELLRGIFGYGFDRPSSIQRRAILPIIKGKDVIAQAQSGSGKTAAYVIGVLQNINPDELTVQALVLVPTRELAENVKGLLKNLSEYLGLKTHVCAGGIDADDRAQVLQSGMHIVVGTPGRVSNCIQKGIISVSNLRTLVIDEADELLSRGFNEEIRSIASMIPSKSQVCIFSATTSKDIREIAELIMDSPVKIIIRSPELTLAGVQQYYFPCLADELKLECIFELFNSVNITQCVIYVNTKDKCLYLEKKLLERHLNCLAIHPDQPAEDRTKALQNVRSGNCRLVITTDDSAGEIRNNINFLLNFELPRESEQYLSRMGRSGAYGRRVTAISVVTEQEVQTLSELRHTFCTDIELLSEDLSQLSL